MAQDFATLAGPPHRTTLGNGGNSMKHTLLLAVLLSSFTAPVLAATLCPDGQYHADGACKLCPDGSYTTAPRCALAPDGNYVPDYGRGSKLAPDGGISPIPVPWFCARMVTTIQVEAVGYFQMADTLDLNNRLSLTFCSSGTRCLSAFRPWAWHVSDYRRRTHVL
jgi:hypothetical protein